MNRFSNLNVAIHLEKCFVRWGPESNSRYDMFGFYNS